MKRVLLVIGGDEVGQHDGLASVNGVERIILDMVSNRPPETEYVLLYYPGGVFENELRKHCLAVIPYETTSKFDLASVRFLRRIIRKYGVNIIHSHSYRQDFMCALANVLIGKKHVITRHVALYEHEHRERPLKYLLYKAFDTVSFCLCTKIVLLSEFAREGHKRVYPGFLRKKYEVVYNGVNTGLFGRNPEARTRLRKELGIAENTLLFCMVAQLRPIKGILEFLDTVEKLLAERVDCHFLLVGDGGLRDLVRKRLEGAPLNGQVTYLGVRKDVPDIINASDAGVLASFAEGVPMFMLECMAVGKAFIAYQVGGIPEVMREGENGLFAEPGNADELLAKLKYAATHLAELERIGATNRAAVRERYSLDRMLNRYEELYESHD